MDEDEDEDNLNDTENRGSEHGLLIIKSNMRRIVYHGKRLRTSNFKIRLEKFSLLLFAFVFTNLPWCTFADDAELLNDSRTRTNSILISQLENFRDFSQSSVLKRRIRHDTTKNTVNERLISFEAPNAESDDVAQSLKNSTSKTTRREDTFGDRDFPSDRYALVKRKYRSSKIDQLTSIATTNKLSTLRYNESCSCFSGRKKTSRVFHNLTITLHHHILNTSEGIIAGVVYRGKYLYFVFSSNYAILRNI